MRVIKGMELCRMGAQESVWWPGLSQELYKTNTVTQCVVCVRESAIRREPMMSRSLCVISRHAHKDDNGVSNISVQHITRWACSVHQTSTNGYVLQLYCSEGYALSSTWQWRQFFYRCGLLRFAPALFMCTTATCSSIVLCEKRMRERSNTPNRQTMSETTQWRQKGKAVVVSSVLKARPLKGVRNASLVTNCNNVPDAQQKHQTQGNHVYSGRDPVLIFVSWAWLNSSDWQLNLHVTTSTITLCSPTMINILPVLAMYTCIPVKYY